MTKGLKRKQLFYDESIPKMGRQSSQSASHSKKSLSQLIKKLGNEKKGHDTIISDGPFTNTITGATNAYVLNAVQQGAAEYQRVGRRIELDSLRIKGNFYTQWDTAALATVGTTIRMVVVWDKQQSSGLNFDAIFGSTNNIGTESCNFMDAIRYDQIGRFSILRDVVLDMNPPTGIAGLGASNISQVKSIDEFIKLNGKETLFDQTTAPGGIADICQGTVLVYFRVSSVTGSASYSTNMTARLRYHD